MVPVARALKKIGVKFEAEELKVKQKSEQFGGHLVYKCLE